MIYNKPKILAENKKLGSFAAGCNQSGTGSDLWCNECQRAK